MSSAAQPDTSPTTLLDCYPRYSVITLEHQFCRMRNSTDSLGGWSLSLSDFYDPDATTDTEVESLRAASPDVEAIDASPPEAVDEVSQHDEHVSDVYSTLSLREILSILSHTTQKNHHVHVPAEQQRFRNLVGWVMQQSPVAEWLSLGQSPSLLLELPPDFDHYSLTRELLDTIRETSTYAQTHVSYIRNFGESERTTTGVQMLSSLCLSLLKESDVEVEELAEEVRHASETCHDKPLENVLGSLASSLLLLTDSVMITYAFDNAPTETQTAIVQNLLTLIERTEVRIKLAIIVYGNANLSLKTTTKIRVDSGDEGTRDALFKDCQFIAARIAAQRPKLLSSLEQVLTLGKPYLDRPLGLLSYLEYVREKVHVTSRQPELDQELIYHYDLVLSRIMRNLPVHERDYVGRMIASVQNSARHLKLDELTITIRPINEKIKEDNHCNEAASDTPVDIQYDLSRLLRGTIESSTGIVNFSAPHIHTYLQRKDVCAEFDWFVSEQEAHSHLAIVCLDYLASWAAASYPRVEGTKIAEEFKKWPLLDYAVRYWHYHFDKSRRGQDEERHMLSTIGNINFIGSWAFIWLYLDFQRPHRLDVKVLEDIQPAVISAQFGVDMVIAAKTFLKAAQLVALSNCNKEVAVLCAISRVAPTSSVLDAKLSTLSDPSPYLRHLPSLHLKKFLSSNEHIAMDRGVALIFAASVLQEGAFDILGNVIGLISSDVESLPWHYTLIYDCVSIFEELLNGGKMSEEQFAAIQPQLLQASIKCGKVDAFSQILGLRKPSSSTLSGAMTTATRRGLAEIVRQLLQYSSDIDFLASDDGRWTPLHHACFWGYRGLVKILIDSHMSMMLKDFSSRNAFHLAVTQGHIQIVELMLDYCDVCSPHEPNGESDMATVNETTNPGPEVSEVYAKPKFVDLIGAPRTQMTLMPSSTIEEVAAHGDVPMMRLLVKYLQPKALADYELLHIAVRCERIEMVKYLLGLEGIDIDRRDRRERTALHVGIMERRTEIIKTLLENGARIDTKDQWGDSPLEDACRYSTGEVVSLLLHERPGGDESLGNCLRRLASNGNTEVIEELLDSGVDINLGDSDDRTALHGASYCGMEDTIKLLLMRRADLERVDIHGDTPLSDAAGQEKTNAVKLLLDAGAEFNWKDASTNWPVKIAAMADSVEIMKMFIDRGASLDGPNDSEHLLETLVNNHCQKTLELILHTESVKLEDDILDRCFYLAMRNDDTGTLSMLWDKGADPNRINADTRYGAALHECAYHGNLLMAKALLEHPGSTIEVNLCAGEFQTAVIAAVCRPDASTKELSEKAAERATSKMFERRCRMLDYLVNEKKADVAITGGLYGNLLNATATQGSSKLLKHVIDTFSLTPDSVDQEGRSPVHTACRARENTVETLEVLSAIDPAILFKTDKQGRQPIHLACGRTQTAAVRYLVEEKSADIKVLDNDGWTPLHWAARQWDIEMVEYLTRLGADIHARTNEGKTAWHIACQHGYSEFESFLTDESFRNEGEDAEAEGEWTGAVCDSCFCVSFERSFFISRD